MSHNFKLINTEYLDKVNGDNFEEIALSLFSYQYENNKLYGQFVRALNIDVVTVDTISKIPFLPVSFFKTHKVVTGYHEHFSYVFESSGTTAELPGRHFVADGQLYEDALLKGFTNFYGDPANYVIIALLPSYLERKTASLVHMAKVLMEKSGHKDGGFYLNEFDKLADVLKRLEEGQQPVLLVGVTFALLDFAERYPMHMKHTVVMETGGMKGRRTEWTRQQVHEYLKQQWGIDNVHSEYGMTELLSQAYARNAGIFETSPTMRVLVRDINDPFDIRNRGTGCLNIVDLANVYSCAFIATDDIGTIHDNGFEVLGRADHSALRGCNLMVL